MKLSGNALTKVKGFLKCFTEKLHSLGSFMGTLTKYSMGWRV